MELESLREEVAEKLEHSGSGERWFAYLALTTVFLAVCATLSSFKEENNAVESVLNQSRAADQWAFYQAKSIKSYLYEMQKDKLALDIEAPTFQTEKTVQDRYRQLIDAYTKDIGRYDKEKEEISAKAKEYEKTRDEAQWKADTFGTAIIFLQMGILLCSLSALMKRKLLWLCGSIVGVVGVFYFANGFLRFMA